MAALRSISSGRTISCTGPSISCRAVGSSISSLLCASQFSPTPSSLSSSRSSYSTISSSSPLSQLLHPLPVSSPFSTGGSIRHLRSIARNARVSPYNVHPSLPSLTASQSDALKRKQYTLPNRTGTLALKRGMTAVYDPESGIRTPCTVLQLDYSQVVALKTVEKHGYFAVQMGAGFRKPKNVTLPMQGHYAAAGVSPKRKLSEFRVKAETGLPPVGSVIRADWLQVGQFVDVQGVSKGKGFSGGMKLHGWSGQPASHGNSKNHRTMGSSGGSQGSGSRVIPGKNMPGRMGHHNVTVQNLEVLRIDDVNDVVLVKGAVPGPKGSYVKIRDAIRKPWPEVESVPESVLPKVDFEALSKEKESVLTL